MNYYCVGTKTASGILQDMQVEVSFPDVPDGVVFEALHDYGDSRGIIIATESSLTEFQEEYISADSIIASHLEWFAAHPEDRSARFVLNGKHFEPVL